MEIKRIRNSEASHWFKNGFPEGLYYTVLELKGYPTKVAAFYCVNGEVSKELFETVTEARQWLLVQAAKEPVNHPYHYNSGKYECIEVMLDIYGVEFVKNFCMGNVFKYIFRYKNKNGFVDVKKAKWYLDKFIELSAVEELDDEVLEEQTE